MLKVDGVYIRTNVQLVLQLKLTTLQPYNLTNLQQDTFKLDECLENRRGLSYKTGWVHQGQLTDFLVLQGVN